MPLKNAVKRSRHLKELSITYVPLASFQDAVELETAIVNVFSLHLPFLTKSSNILISRIISSFVFPFQLTADFCKLKINDNLLIKKKKKKAQNLLCSFSLNGIQTTLAPSFCSSTQKFHHNRTTWLMETIILTMKHCVVSFTTITGSQSVRTYWAIIG